MTMSERLIIADDFDCTDVRRRKIYSELAPLGVGIKYESLIHTPRFLQCKDSVTVTTGAMLAHSHARKAGIKKFFWDAKLKGNPDAIRRAVRGISQMNVWGFTFHADMPQKAITAAVESRSDALALGVTTLTSWDDDWCRKLYDLSGEVVVRMFVKHLRACGASGFVCPGKALPHLASKGLLDGMCVTVAGIRSGNSADDDHATTVTATEAIRNGATHLVVGRPIMGNMHPADEAKRFIDEMETAAANHSVV